MNRPTSPAAAAWGVCLTLLLAACTPTTTTQRPAKPDAKAVAADAKDGAPAKPAPFPSTYRMPTSGPVLISGATVLTGTGERLDGTDVLLRDGKVAAIGKGLAAAPGTQ
ncbi:MAG: hypothetical protein ACKO9D_00935, partial [Gammaproteobacteria bacterium]